jgi:choline dehydrogenase-like flavoprotein
LQESLLEKSSDHLMNFDYVIVGGGSAGCCLAGRLSEDPDKSVCLIEAGPADSDPPIKIPLALINLIGNPRFDWCYKSAPHRHMSGRTVSVPRGKSLGGSGSINSMVYIRGRPSDYDTWARLGCSGWNWESVLPYFIKAETNRRLDDDPLHGGDGPLNVEDLRSPDPMLEQYVAAGRENGIPENRDFNGISQEGLGAYQATMNKGRRWSAADAYLRPALGRKNRGAGVSSADAHCATGRIGYLEATINPLRATASGNLQRDHVCHIGSHLPQTLPGSDRHPGR